MRALYINEKFAEESDPVHDMGIGSKKMIIEWLDKMGIPSNKYTINNDLTIDVEECHVFLSQGKLGPYSELPPYIQFGTVIGAFNIQSNKLTTLRGCPKYVLESNDYWGTFSCANNRLRSLKYAPLEVQHHFICSGNPGKFTTEDVLAVCKTPIHGITI